MKRTFALLITLLALLSCLYSRGYIGFSVSPYFDGGSVSWLNNMNSSDDALTFKADHFEFGTEINIDFGLYKDWGKHSFGGEAGLGIALPIINRNGVDDYPLYTYAFTPYLAASYAYAPREDIRISFSLGLGSSLGKLDEKTDDGLRLEGHTYDLEYFSNLSVMYSFSPEWALRGGISATFTTLILPEDFKKFVYDENGNKIDEDYSALAVIYSIEPYIGIAYTL